MKKYINKLKSPNSWNRIRKINKCKLRSTELLTCTYKFNTKFLTTGLLHPFFSSIIKYCFSFLFITS